MTTRRRDNTPLPRPDLSRLRERPPTSDPVNVHLTDAEIATLSQAQRDRLTKLLDARAMAATRLASAALRAGARNSAALVRSARFWRGRASRMRFDD